MAKGQKGGRRPAPKGKGSQGPTRPRSGAGGAAGGGGGRASAKPTRAERIEAGRAARRRRETIVRLVVVVAVVALVAGVAAVVTASREREQEAVEEVEAGGCEYDEEYDGDLGTGRNHVPSPTYRVDPPAGGDHLSSAAPPGRYTITNTPADGQLVHALEHGFVILWHKPDLAEADRAAVDGVADTFRRELLIVPRPSLTTAVAVTAWHRRLVCQKADADAIGDFIENFRDQGPEKGFL